MNDRNPIQWDDTAMRRHTNHGMHKHSSIPDISHLCPTLQPCLVLRISAGRMHTAVFCVRQQCVHQQRQNMPTCVLMKCAQSRSWQQDDWFVRLKKQAECISAEVFLYLHNYFIHLFCCLLFVGVFIFIFFISVVCSCVHACLCTSMCVCVCVCVLCGWV